MVFGRRRRAHKQLRKKMRKIDANVSSESLGVSAIDFKSQTQTVTVIQIPNTYSLVFYFYCFLFFDFEPKPVLRKQENS